MATRERPGDRGARDARELGDALRRELRTTRIGLSMSIDAAARRAGISPAALWRLEQGRIAEPTLAHVCRAARAVGMRASVRLYPLDELVRDTPQLRVLERFARVLAPPLRMAREVRLPLGGDQRAWDARITDGQRSASVEAESKLTDVQAVSRRVALKQRDDPECGPVLLLLARTAHNRRVLAEHREALRAQFPLDGGAILRALRQGRLPPAGGIVML
jgi:transcriptional regulator with XRE-family HTH domain